MKSQEGRADPAGLGAIRWLTIHDDLLRALAHAVSNRMATVAATASLLEHGITPDPRVAGGLAAEVPRMERLLEALRELPRRVAGAPEPLLLTDAIAGARLLVEEHPELRDRPVQVTARGEVFPVRAEPGAVRHAAAVAILTAARYTAAGHPVRLTLETVGDEVCLTAAGDDGPHHGAEQLREADVQAIAWLLADAGVRAESHASGCRFSLPTLAASRRAPV